MVSRARFAEFAGYLGSIKTGLLVVRYSTARVLGVQVRGRQGAARVDSKRFLGLRLSGFRQDVEHLRVV